MKLGDIFKNNWAYYETYFMFLTPVYQKYPRQNLANGIGIVKDKDGKWIIKKHTQMYLNDLGSEKVPLVGHIDLMEVILNSLGIDSHK
jgi:hypothetical protein